MRTNLHKSINAYYIQTHLLISEIYLRCLCKAISNKIMQLSIILNYLLLLLYFGVHDEPYINASKSNSSISSFATLFINLLIQCKLIIFLDCTRVSSISHPHPFTCFQILGNSQTHSFPFFNVRFNRQASSIKWLILSENNKIKSYSRRFSEFITQSDQIHGDWSKMSRYLQFMDSIKKTQDVLLHLKTLIIELFHPGVSILDVKKIENIIGVMHDAIQKLTPFKVISPDLYQYYQQYKNIKNQDNIEQAYLIYEQDDEHLFNNFHQGCEQTYPQMPSQFDETNSQQDMIQHSNNDDEGLISNISPPATHPKQT